MTKKIIIIGILVFCGFFLFAQENDVLFQALKEELNYEMEELKAKEYSPYYMEFRVRELNVLSLSTLNGSVVDETKTVRRIFKPSIRMGDYTFDNTHQLENTFGTFPIDYSVVREPFLPIDDNKAAIKFKIWQNTNQLYQNAIIEYREKLEAMKNKEKPKVADFSKEEPQKYYEEKLGDEQTNVNLNKWVSTLAKMDSVFSMAENYYCGGSSITFTHGRDIFVSSEGTEVVQNFTFCSLSINGFLKLEDNEVFTFAESFNVLHPSDLPDEESLLKIIAEKAAIMEKISKAEKAEPYTGPAILSPEATGVFFHEIFGHRIEGHRLNDMYDSKTFKKKIGEAVLPSNFSVISDPTREEYNGIKLIGHYKYDDQGMKAQKVINVENGILKQFLMSRKPVEEFEHSNGHGRGDILSEAVSRQSNLFITVENGLSDDKLRKRLIKECKKQGKKYGYYFKTVSGGFTNTMMFSPDYFNILPIEVYRVYTDKRPDELVRGVNLIGTPLMMFSEILAAGQIYSVFSGICGAESGSLPVTTIAPAILVNKIETQNKMSVKPDWPILPPPTSK